ncbi:ATP-binding protein [Streptomyces sp. SID8374]|uniref:ATP-binding protein n=1 Tax=Streptomyces sp. SID8374 TaxID=2690354 RepID=UPI001369D93A|nr:ATP-binding protein [Streptomyces sp. SID8374]
MQVLQVQLEVGPDPAEVGRARRWARSRLVGSGIGDDEPLAETLILLISELVTNAVVHTGCPAVLRMLFGGGGGAGEAGTVRVEVADASDCPPRPRHAEGDDTNGRGLELVDGLADRWGWQPEGAGKQIWCEVDRGAPVGGPMGAPGADREAPRVVAQEAPPKVVVQGGEVCEPPSCVFTNVTGLAT